MYDTGLNEKLSQGIKAICEEKGIQKVSFIELVINQEISLDLKDFKEKLMKNLPTIVGKKTKLYVNQEQLGMMKAIIKNVEGK